MGTGAHVFLKTQTVRLAQKARDKTKSKPNGEKL